MIVERIDSLAGFDGLREAYEAAYASDPHRTVFVAWGWLRAYFASMEHRWMLLAARNEHGYRGFCVLVERGVRAATLQGYREIALGAYPTADYTSLVIAGDEESVLDALASAIDAMAWDLFRASNVRDPRVRRLVERIGRSNVVEEEAPNPCRYVSLPSTWGEYVARDRGNGAETSLRYVKRRYRDWSNARLAVADERSLDRDIETLLQLNHRRWRTNLRKARRTYGRLFREAYARGCCRIAVLRDGERPIAAQAAFVDPERRSWGIYMLGSDRKAQRSPGIGMLAKGLEHAIGERFQEYDFLRGEESYKRQFGAQLRWLENFVVRRQKLRSRVAARAWSSGLRMKSTIRHLALSVVA